MGTTNSSSGGESVDSDEVISSINITPFVDVVLVLLVVFMVTAPALMKDTLGLQLPKSSQADPAPTFTLGISITRSGQVLLEGVPIEPEAFRARIKEAMIKNPEVQAVLSADQETKHGDVVRVMDWVKGAGLSKFAIQIQRE